MPESRRATGRLFHVAEETANARGPIVTVQVRGTKRRPAAAERSRERPSIELTVGYGEPCRHRTIIWRLPCNNTTHTRQLFSEIVIFVT